MRKRIVVAIAVTVIVGGCGTSPASTAPSSTTSEAPSRQPTAVASPTPSAAPTAPPQGSPIVRSSLHGLIVFSDDNDIWVAHADGSGRRRLTTDPAPDFDPSWSPDGRLIAFRSHRTGDEEIFVMRADGTEERDISNSPGGDWSPAFSRDGHLIAFSSDRGGEQQVWLMTPEGTGLRRVTTIEGEYPSFSPDGTRLAFASGQGGLYDVFTTSVAGGDLRNVTSTPASYDFAPAWSPDGRYIAYDTQRDYAPIENGVGPEFEIHVFDLVSGIDRRVTFNRDEDRFPCWSPDGQYLLWSRGGELIVARPDGTGEVSIGSGTFPDWVADGP